MNKKTTLKAPIEEFGKWTIPASEGACNALLDHSKLLTPTITHTAQLKAIERGKAEGRLPAITRTDVEQAIIEEQAWIAECQASRIRDLASQVDKLEKQIFELENPDLWFTYQGIEIHHTEWKNDCYSENFYAPCGGLDSEAEEAFDVRDLPEVPEGYQFEEPDPEWDDDQKAIAYAIEQGWITETGLELPPVTDEERSNGPKRS